MHWPLLQLDSNTLGHSFWENRALGADPREGFDDGNGNDALAVGREGERSQYRVHMAALLF